MNKKIYFAIILAFFSAILAEKSCAQSNTNWGESVEGMQMSIALSNNVVKVGSTVCLQCLAQNSTNGIIIIVGDPNLDMQIILADESGKTYDLSRFPGGGDRPGRDTGGLRSGETEKYIIPISITSNVHPGLYRLKAHLTLRVGTEDSNHKMIFRFPKVFSNSMEVQIK